MKPNWGLTFAGFVFGVCFGLLAAYGGGINLQHATGVPAEEIAIWQTAISTATPYSFTPKPTSTITPDTRQVVLVGPPEPEGYQEGTLITQRSKTFTQQGRYVALRISVDKTASVERYEIIDGHFTITPGAYEFVWVWRFDIFSDQDQNELEAIRIALSYSWLKEIRTLSGPTITRP